MATVIENRKNGKTVSYKFRAYLGRNEVGKQINRYTTWFAPDDLTPARALKAAKKAAEEWENAVKTEYEKDCIDPARIREREINEAATPFVRFVHEIWFPLVICDGQHKATTLTFYRSAAKLSDPYFKDKTIQKINAQDIQSFFNYLWTQYKTKQGKHLSPKTLRHQYR